MSLVTLRREHALEQTNVKSQYQKSEQNAKNLKKEKNSIQFFVAITETETQHKSEKMAVGGHAATNH